MSKFNSSHRLSSFSQNKVKKKKILNSYCIDLGFGLQKCQKIITLIGKPETMKIISKPNSGTLVKFKIYADLERVNTFFSFSNIAMFNQPAAAQDDCILDGLSEGVIESCKEISRKYI